MVCMRMKKTSPSLAYRLLEPGPIVLLTTYADKHRNVMTMGFHMMVQHDPPLIGCIVGPWNHSFDALRSTGECVIAIPAVDLAKKVVDIGNCSGSDLDKFDRFSLTIKKATKVSAPLITDCIANIECCVSDDRMVDEHNMFILSAEQIWIYPDRAEKRTLHHRGDGSFNIDGRVLDLSDRMTKWRDLPA